MKTDEELIRSALDAAIGAFERNDAIDWNCLEQASEALTRLTARCIPQLPDGWRLRMYKSSSGKWKCELDNSNDKEAAGTAPSPRDAVLAAIARIGEQKS